MNISPTFNLNNNFQASYPSNFTKVNSDTVKRLLGSLKTEEISLSYDKKYNKKILYTKTEITINYPDNKWDSKIISCGLVSYSTKQFLYRF